MDQRETRRARPTLLVVVAVTIAVTPSPAGAGAGLWAPLELRAPLRGEPGEPWALAIRTIAEPRFDFARGLTQQFLRVGPVLAVRPWVELALQGTVVAQRDGRDRFETEGRVEAEATFILRRPWLVLSDRNRLEYRYREAIGHRGRYRNFVRLAVPLPGTPLAPFVADELLVDLEDGPTQNRAFVGLAIQALPHVRIDVAYLWRAQTLDRYATWTHDHVAWIYLFVTVPRSASSPPPR